MYEYNSEMGFQWEQTEKRLNKVMNWHKNHWEEKVVSSLEA